ncbi:MAG TPA: cytochrome P450 [Solirubrobacteraceae bacterium]|jgi:cytochrome P450|nr:cytochrome P450 [Solirubrobacteraceae bacterium]
MSTVEAEHPPVATATSLVGEVAPSPAGPAQPEDLSLPAPPRVALPRTAQILRINQRQLEFVFRWRRELGETFQFDGIVRGTPTITCHPDHVRSLFKADPSIAPSITAESPLKPVVGPNSVLTANGPRHLRQRKLLLPPFHGEAIERYSQMISEATEKEIDRWPVGAPVQLAPRMQAITLDVIMAGIFGFEGVPKRSSPEYRLRQVVKHIAQVSTWPVAQLAELLNLGHDEPVGLTKQGVALLDAVTYPIIRERRRVSDLQERTDIMSLIMRARTEDGEPLSDRELRDELLTLVLAGFETTANSLAWTWERLVRFPQAHERLREAVRTDADDKAEQIEAVIVEAMRTRPVIPSIGRRVAVPWRLGGYVVPADTPIIMSIALLHHREDLYPDPFAYRPERWLGRKPGTYEWIPFGGGTRRCLGAALAMAEQRVVLEAMVRRLDIELDPAAPEPERVVHRNVTMIPRGGARVIIRSRR